MRVSADERYQLFIDGERVGQGSERGDPFHWYYERYSVTLRRGPHTVVALVWSLGALAPFAQTSVQAGFILDADAPLADRLNTGAAVWEARVVPGYTFIDPFPAWGTGANIVLDGSRYPWGVTCGHGDGWEATSSLDRGISALNDYEFRYPRVLTPSTLPPMMAAPVGGLRVRYAAPGHTWNAPVGPVRLTETLADEVAAWQTLVMGHGAVAVPPHTTRTILIDLDDYYCAYPKLVVTGGQGSRVRLLWAESLYESPVPSVRDPLMCHQTKGNRDEVAHKFFHGVGDTFLPDGGAERVFEPFWWQAGRYVQLAVETADMPLTIESLTLTETRYPLEMNSTFIASDARLVHLIPLLVRGLQMCAHETYVDCPYYEQLMYVGDTRLQALTTYVMTRDDRLPRKAISLFGGSRLALGFTQARYPSRVLQYIAPFSLWWVGMVSDYALWRGDSAFVRAQMPSVRAILEAYLQYQSPEGLIAALPGWNFMDWVPDWTGGIPPDGAHGASALINWHFIWALKIAAQLEELIGESLLAARWQALASQLARYAEVFWDEACGLYADDIEHSSFSEHTQCLALLSGQLDPVRVHRVADGLLSSPDLTRTTIYFTHYLFEACRSVGRMDALFDRLPLWFDLMDNGLRTPVEQPEPTRSDCHGWGAHPLYHYFASILGIRPVSPGFQTVQIEPQLGTLGFARGSLVHPQGEITVEFIQQDGRLHGIVSLPTGISGYLHVNEKVIPLFEGQNEF